MKLLYSPASPYSAKARMAAHYLGFAVESLVVDTGASPAILVDNNPLAKIPTLILDDGRSVFDSVAIMHFLDRESGGKLYSADHATRTQIEIREALCDGIMDCLLAIVYERRFRPAEMIHQPWIDKQWGKVEKGLDHLEANFTPVTGALTGGDFAMAAMISYLDLRFAGLWQDKRPQLAAWSHSFEQVFPAYAQMKSGA